MSTPNYEEWIGMTAEQQHEWYRKEKQDTQRLGEEFTHFLNRLCERTSQGSHFNENGLWNCQDWLPQALAANGVEHEHHRHRYGDTGTVSFTLYGGSFTIAECDMRVRMQSDDYTEGDNDPHNMGTLLQMGLYGSTAETNFRLRLRWFGLDSDAAENGMTVDDFHQRRWAFPSPVWCHMLGNNDHARKWLTLVKLTFPA